MHDTTMPQRFREISYDPGDPERYLGARAAA